MSLKTSVSFLIGLSATFAACDRHHSDQASDTQQSNLKIERARKEIEAPPRKNFDFRSKFEQVQKSSTELSLFNRELEALPEEELRKLLSDITWKKESDRGYASAILMALASQSTTSALDAIASIPNSGDPSVVPALLCAILAKRDPEVALAWFQENLNPSSKATHHVALMMLSDLSRNNAEATISMISRISGENKKIYLPFVMRALAMADPEMAIKLARDNFKGSDLDRSMIPIISVIATSDPTRAASLLTSLPSEIASECAKDLLPVLISSGSAEMSKILSNFSPKDLQNAMQQSGVIEKMVAANPGKAKDLINTVPFTEQSKAIYQRMAVALAATDPNQAIQFLNTLPSSNASNEIARAMFANLASTDPQAALDRVSTLPSLYQSFAARGIVQVIAEQDPATALKIAATVTPSYRQDAYREIARKLAFSNPLEAVSILDDPKMNEVLGDGFRTQMLDQTVRTWASKDLAGAQTWVENLPASDKPQGVQGLMTAWVKSDPIAASEWLGKLPSGAARDAGARIIVDQLRNTDPVAAEQWRKTITPTAPK